MEAELDAQIQQACLRSQHERFDPLSASENAEAESGAPLGETAESAPITKKVEKAHAKAAAKEAKAEAKAAKKNTCKKNKKKGIISPMEGADDATVEEVQLNPLAEPSSVPNLQHTRSHAAFESKVEVFDT